MTRVNPVRVLNLFVFCICVTVWVPFSIEVAGLNLRLSQLMLPFVLLVLGSAPATWRVSIWSLVAVACGAAWWMALAVFTLFGDTSLGHPAGRVLLMALNLVHAAAVYLLVVRWRALRSAVRTLLWSVAVLNILLLAVSVGAAAGVPVPTSWLAPEVTPVYQNGHVVGLLVRRFVFGGVLAGCVSAAAGAAAMCLFIDPGWRSRGLLILTLVSALIGMVVGFSRQSILSLLVAGLVVLPFVVRRGTVTRLLKLAGLTAAATAAALLIMLATPSGRSYLDAFAGRAALVADPTAYETGTAQGRRTIRSGMWRDIAANPILGRGQDAYLPYMDTGEGSHNFPLEVLHSTGLLGFLPYLALHLIPLGLAAAVLLGPGGGGDLRYVLLACLAVYVAMLSASVTNLIFWNPVYWMALALLLAGARVAETASSSEPARAGSSHMAAIAS